MTDRTEIRCCCDAGKLLGTIPHPGTTQGGVKVALHVMGHEPIVLEWGRVYLPWRRHGYYALKSMHQPIEVLRQIPGFEENYDD